MKIRTGIASFGLSGRVFHAPFIAANPGFELSAIVERTKDLSAAEYPDALIVRSFEELLTLREIELVVVNTPDDTHYDYCRMALEAGKNVVVEKPFVSTVRQAEELVALAERKGLMLMAYQNRRLDGDYLTVKKIIKDGALGRVVEMYTGFQRFRPEPAMSWKEDPHRRKGILYDLGTHCIDQSLDLFGMPLSVWAASDKLRDGAAMSDFVKIILRYPRLMVSITCSYLVKAPAAQFAVHGTAGSYTAFACDPQEEALKNGARDVLSPSWGAIPQEQWGTLDNGQGRRPYPALQGNYMPFYDNVYKVLRDGAHPMVTHAQMIALMRLLEAASESIEAGNCVKVQEI